MTSNRVLILCLVLTLFAFAPIAFAVPDSDGDGILDNADNCQLVPNANQRDTDNDGFGNICDADLNNNGIVNAIDLGIFKAAFFGTPASPNWNPHADFDGNNVVNVLDLGRLKLGFFLPPGPVAYARWNVNTSGNWSNAANWFPISVPGPTSNVLIDRPVPVTVTYDAAAGNRTVVSVTSNHPLILAGGALTVTDTIQVNNSFTLAGGRLNAAHVLAGAGGQGVSAAEANASYLDGVTLGAHLTVNNGAQVYVSGGLTLANANITMASTNTYTYLIFQDTQTLGGTGELRFGGTTPWDYTNWIYPSGGATLTIGPNITTRALTAGGILGYTSGGMTVMGPVISNLNGRRVTVAGNALSLQAPVTGSGGGAVTVEGNWTNVSGNPIAVTGANLTLSGNWTNQGSITNTNGNLTVGVYSTDAWTNSGTINLVNSPAVLGGLLTPANLGSITTNAAVQLVGNLVNTGLTTDLASYAGGNVSFGSGARVTGGTLGGTTTLTIPEAVYMTLDGVTLATHAVISNGAYVTVTNGLTLNGVNVTLAASNAYTYLWFQDTQTLAGTGELRFGGTTPYDYLNWIYQAWGGATLTIAPGITTRTVTSGGQLGYSATGLVSRGPVISNLPGRTVTVAGNLLSLQGPVTGSAGGHVHIDGNWTNVSGNTVSVTGGNLTLRGTWANAGTITNSNGLFNAGLYAGESWTSTGAINLTNAPATLGGTLTAANLASLTTNSTVQIVGNLVNTGQTFNTDLFAGNLSLGSGARITGGTIAGTGTFTLPASIYIYLDGVTIATHMVVGNGTTVYVENGMTLANRNVTLASDNAYTYLAFQGTQTLGGTGEVRFGGTTIYDYLNWIYQTYGGATLTIDPGVTVRAMTSGGQLGYSTGLLMRGALIVDLADRDVFMDGSPLTVQGSLSVGPTSRILSSSTTLTLASTASVDLDLGPTGNGELETTGALVLNGTLNLALVGGLTPAGCSGFDLIRFASRSGNFTTVNGPVFGGGGFSIVPFAKRLRAVTPGTGCSVNHAEYAGVTTAASSIYSTGYDHTLAIDGIDSTSSSWCTANNDPSPSITVTLPVSTTLMSLGILTSYSPSYDFLTGRFIARNAANATVYNSGIVALTAGEVSHVVTPNIANVRSVEFIGLTWNSIEPCLSELQVFGPLP